MPGRVLNFLEFSDKYSGGDNEFSLDDMKNASSNFEEGFDDDTYNLPEIGANRPVSGEYETAPSSDDSTFSEENSDEMNAPSDEPIESVPTNDSQTNDESDEDEEEESDEDEEEESDEDEEEESDDEEEEELEEGNPEAGANPKKKVDESITLVKGFHAFINENHYDEHGDYSEEDYSEEDYSDEYGDYSEDDEYGMYPEEEEECCSACGEVPIENEYGYSCGCNM